MPKRHGYGVTGLPGAARLFDRGLMVVRSRGPVSEASVIPETDGVDGIWIVAAPSINKASPLSPLVASRCGFC